MNTQTLGLLAILPLVVGVAGFSSIGAFQGSSDIRTYDDSSSITGHVTVIQRDAEGFVKAYQQYDNIITNEGLSCISEVAFGSTNSTACTAASTVDPFKRIGLLGTAPSPQAEWTTATGAANTLTGGGLDAINATSVGTDVEGDGATTTQGKSITAIQHTFTKSNATAATVGGATLENSNGDALFAAKAFTGGDLVLNESDTLEITWSIQIGS